MIINFDSNKIQITFNNLEDDINEIIINGNSIIPLNVFKNSKGSIMIFVDKYLNFNLNNNSVCGVHKLYGDFNGKINEEITFVPINREHGFNCDCH